MICEFCNKSFSTKSNLFHHQKTAKFCLDLQGKSDEKTIECDFCFKKFTVIYTLKDHITVCKEKIKKERELHIENEKKKQERINKSSYQLKLKNEYEIKLKELQKEYEVKLKEKQEEMERRLDKKTEEYEIKLREQKNEYEVKLEKKETIIATIAMKPTNSSTKTMNVIHNHNTLNFDDKERLNNVIRNNIDYSIVQKGQVGFAGVLYHKYLKNDDGNQLYKIVDTSRQNFEYIDENGKVKTDIGAQKLTEAVVKSDLSKHVSNIAKDIPNLYDKNGSLDSVLQLTDFEKDNSKFRKEIVRLTKSENE